METLIYRGYAGRKQRSKKPIPVEVYLDRETGDFRMTLMSTPPKKPFNIGGVRVVVDVDKIAVDVEGGVQRLMDETK